MVFYVFFLVCILLVFLLLYFALECRLLKPFFVINWCVCCCEKVQCFKWIFLITFLLNLKACLILILKGGRGRRLEKKILLKLCIICCINRLFDWILIKSLQTLNFGTLVIHNNYVVPCFMLLLFLSHECLLFN